MIIDLTHTISPETFVYPGTPRPAFSSTRTLTHDGARETLLQMGSHTGTHMDAPRHILPDGCGLDQLPPSQFCGRAAVIDVSHFAPGSCITAEFLRSQNGYLRCAEYALLYTGWEKKWGTEAFLSEEFPVLDEEAARYLVSCGLKGVGTDAISIDRMSDSRLPIHHILLRDSVMSIENLCLKKVRGREDFLFFVLPLKFEDADGAPVRAFADLRDSHEEDRRGR